MKEKPIIAIIAAAGLGKHLWPITQYIPKEMFPVGNNPLIHYLVENIAKSGIRDVVIAIRPEKRVIREYLGNGHSFGVHIHYVLGSPAGPDQTLRAARPYLKKGPFLLTAADLYIENADLFKELITLYKKHHVSIDVLKKDPKRFFPNFAVPVGKRESTGLWRIRAYRARSIRSTTPVSLGISIVPPTFVRYLPPANKKRETPLDHCLNQFMKDEIRLGHETKEKVFDCSTPEGLIEANKNFLKRKGVA